MLPIDRILHIPHTAHMSLYTQMLKQDAVAKKLDSPGVAVQKKSKPAAGASELGPQFLLQLTVDQMERVEATRIRLGLKSRAETIRVLLSEALK
jgi:hypothetical protein